MTGFVLYHVALYMYRDASRASLAEYKYVCQIAEMVQFYKTFENHKHESSHFIGFIGSYNDFCGHK